MTENKTKIQADEDREEEQSGGLQQMSVTETPFAERMMLFCFVSTGLVVV